MFSFITASRLPVLTPTTTQRRRLPMKFALISRAGTMVFAPIFASTRGCRRPFLRGLTLRFLPWKGRFQRRKISSEYGRLASEAAGLPQAIKSGLNRSHQNDRPNGRFGENVVQVQSIDFTGFYEP